MQGVSRVQFQIDGLPIGRDLVCYLNQLLLADITLPMHIGDVD